MTDVLTQRVTAIIAKSAKRDEAAISAETTFEQLGLDSLDALGVISALEDEFNVSIPNEEVARIRNVGHAIESLGKLLALTSGGGKTSPER